MELAIILVTCGTILLMLACYKAGKRKGESKGYIEASAYYREQEKYLNEMADGYCEYLSNKYERLKKELINKYEVH
jgi:hypothetical protein